MKSERVEVRRGDDGILKFYISTRDGWEEAGFNGLRIELRSENYREGTRITLEEPLEVPSGPVVICCACGHGEAATFNPPLCELCSTRIKEKLETI